ncbi:MAG: flagellin [Pseudomonadota bacterium]
MSSILTNNSAMVALQTLKSINTDLSKTQNEISTGKSVASAKDNAAVWAISKVMESDVSGFKAISESLALGESTVAVARQGSETVTDLLTQIKGKVVAAQEENVDREKIQTDISALRNQINSVVNAAQFNGLNMLKGTEDVNILSSLDRSGDGSVEAQNITMQRQDMTTSTGTYGNGGPLDANGTRSAPTATNAANTATITMATDADYSHEGLTFEIAGTSLVIEAGELSGDQDAAAAEIAGRINALGLEGISASASAAAISVNSTRAFETVDVTATLSVDGTGAGDATVTGGTIAERAENVTFSTSANVNSGDGYKMTVGSQTFQYVAGQGETFEDVAKGLKTAIDGAGIEGVTTKVSQNDSGAWMVKVDNDTSTAKNIALVGQSGGTASGGLFGLDKIDVSTNEGADAALANIENLIQNSIDSSASFGSAQGRIETQSDFISKLTDSLKTGIGTLVDANMEEASARLQALQVQQQLGTQSLSIANQAPQSLLSLFR